MYRLKRQFDERVNIIHKNVMDYIETDHSHRTQSKLQKVVTDTETDDLNGELR